MYQSSALRREGRPFDDEPVHEFRCQMLGIRRTTAVSEEQDLVFPLLTPS